MNSKNKETQEDIELLLPWHAAGTLSRRDAERVERALTNDNQLASRYEAVREELGAAINLNESLGAPSARAMQDLFAKIDAEPVRTPRTSFNVGAWFTGLIASFQPRTLAYAAGAAAIAIMLQAGVLTSLIMQDTSGVYGVASGDTKTPVTRSMSGDIDGSPFVLIRFNPQANVSDISRFLNENNATIEGGPSSGSGLFKLRVSERPVSPNDLDTIVRRMQRNPVVGFTVPAAK